MRDIRKSAASVLSAVTIVLSLPTPVQARQSDAWGELGGSATGGGISNTEWASQGVRMAVGPDGNPVVAWHESGMGGSNVYLRRWDGSAWVELGGSGSGYGLSGTAYHWAYLSSVAVDSTGIIYVGIQKVTDGGMNVHVVRWNGAAWEDLPGPGPAGGVNTASSVNTSSRMVLDPFDQPWVVWNERVSNFLYEIYVRRWDGSSWVEIGSSATAGGISNTPGVNSSEGRLAFDPDGNPIVAWTEARTPSGTGTDVYLRRWSGDAWVEMGGSATGAGINGHGSESSGVRDLVVDSQGRPAVMWAYGVSRKEVYLRRWNGASWQELGGSASGFGISGSRTSGGVELNSNACDLVVDGEDRLIAAWTEGDAATPSQPRLRRWDGNAWEGIDGSDGDEGMGATGLVTHLASIGVSKSGDIFVAWDDGPAGDQEVYVRRWANVEARNLGQFNVVGPTEIPVGGKSAGGGIMFTAFVSRPFSSNPIRLQVELISPGHDFTGLITAQSAFLPSPGVASVTIYNLVVEGWRWRARAVEMTGNVGPWVEFGANPENAIDFYSVEADPPVMPGGPEADDDGGGRCGLLGIEAPMLMALLTLYRNRRRVK